MKNDFYKKIIDEAPIGYAYHKIICDDQGMPCDFEFIEANPVFLKFIGFKGENIIGKKLSEILPQVGESELNWIKFCSKIAIADREESIEHFVKRLNKWYRLFIFSPQKDYFITHFFDISGEKKHAIKISDLQQTVEETDSRRQKAEDALSAKQRQLQDIIEFLPDAIVAIDNDKRIIAWNKAMEKMTGIPASEAMGKDDGVFTIPFYGEVRSRLMYLALSGKDDLQDKYIGYKREGETVTGEAFCPALYNNNGAWILAKASPLHDPAGNIIGAIEIVRDINEQKLAEEALQSKAAFLEAQANSSLDGILVVDDNNTIVLINRRFIEIFKVPPDVLNFDEDEVLLSYVVNLTKEPMQFKKRVKYLDEHIDEVGRDEIELKNGMVLDRHSAPVLGKDGKYYGRIWTFRDITDRICLEKALEKEKNLLEATLVSIGDGIVSTDNNGYIMLFNKAAEALTGWTQEYAIGKTIDELLNIIMEDSTKQKIKDMVEKTQGRWNTIELNDIFFTSPDGKGHFIDNILDVNKDINGNIIGVVATLRDVTEKRIAEKLIRESEEKFRTIFEQASVGIFQATLDRRVIDANQKVCELLGYSIEELRDLSFDVFTYPDDLDLTYKNHYNMLRYKTKTTSYEKRYVKKDGTVIWADISVSLLKDADGEPCYIISTLQDITDRKLAEIALAINESRLKRAQEIAHVGNWELDIASNMIWFSEEALRMHGISQDNPYLPNDIIQRFVLKEDLPKLQNDLQMIIEKNRNSDIEFRINRLDNGRERIMHSNSLLEKDKDGNPVKIVGVIKDITERKKAEEMLQESEAKYKKLYLEYLQKQSLMKSLINSIPDLIFYKDKDSVYLGCNKAFEAFAGATEEEIVGRTDFDLFDKEMATLFRSMDIEMMSQESSRKNEEIVTYPGGKKVYLETLKTPYYDPQGGVLGLIGVSRDITERKKREEEILYYNYHDLLTGLHNRTYIDEVREGLNQESNLPLSIIIGDINGLKLINDALGHSEGDKLLIEMGKILKNCCRPEDIVARTGGDEYCILLPRTSNNQAQAIIARIKRTCEEYASKSNRETCYISISLGHATKTSIEEPFDKVLKNAEQYMYRRKLLEYKSLHSSILSSIKTTMFEKSNETEAHAERLARWSKKIGKALGLDDDKIDELELLSTLHDIGKISVDLNILTKPGELTEEEWAEIKKHPEVGYRIAQASPELRHIADYILCHHEQWDGNGYPQGLKGEKIPLLARILAIVDAYDAMTQDRAYRKAISVEEAVADILANAGTRFDPEIARIFVEMVLNNNQE